MKRKCHSSDYLKTMKTHVSIVALLFGVSVAVRAGDPVIPFDTAPAPVPAPLEAAPDSSGWFKDLWDIPKLYKDPDNPFIQEISLIGRYQYQFGAVDSSQGDWDRGHTRRWRAGAKIKFLQDFELAGSININDDFEPFYNSIEEMHVTWKQSDAFHLKVGKQKPPFTYEWSTSSKRILTFERSLLVNQVLPNKSTGISASGESGKWSYHVGGYLAGRDAEFGNDDEGEFYMASIGYDLSDSFSSFDSVQWRLDYFHNEGDPGSGGPKAYDDALSTSIAFANDDYGLVADLIYAWGDSPDAYGLVLLGHYNFTEQLQLVARYQYANSSDDGLRAQRRYERQVGLADGGRGDEYHAIYAGLNYYLNEHKCKLMAGVEYADLEDDEGDGGDYDGFTYFAGLRLYY